jgi:hypothetical protein
MELPRSRQAEPDLERVRRNSSTISFIYSVICSLKVKTISVPRTGLIGMKAPAGTILRVNRLQKFLVARSSVDLDGCSGLPSESVNKTLEVSQRA